MEKPRCSRSCILILVACVLLLSPIACGGTPEPPLETEVPEETAEPPGPPSDEDYLKWAPPVSYVAIVNSICETLLAAEENMASGEITGIQAFGQVVLANGMLGGLKEGLPDWVADEGQREIRDRLEQHIDDLLEILGPWLNQELDTAALKAQLAEVCPGVRETYDLVVEEAAKDGFSEADIEAMIQELAESEGGGPFDGD